MSQSYVVTAPYVTLKLIQDNGTLAILGFYEGAIVPPNVDPESLERHLEKGMVAKTSSAEGKLAAPAGTPKPGEPPNVPVTEAPVVSRPLAERQKAQAEAADTAKTKADAAKAAADTKAAAEAKVAEDAKVAEAAKRAAARAATTKADS